MRRSTVGHLLFHAFTAQHRPTLSVTTARPSALAKEPVMSASASTPATPRRIGTVPGLRAGMRTGMLASTFASAAIGTMATYWFATPFRYTGLSVSRQLAGVVGGGATPVLAQWLAGPAGTDLTPVAVLLLAMAALSLGRVLSRRRSTRRAGGTDSLLSTPSMVEA
ncbi:hypothetical protein [Streptomyces sp. NPDC056105]|uniref:hypothetical protein n=1 Tax=Streptomyces sp. NPDC056105 TaxID=3345714 RepID=UPI0035DF3C18